MKSSLRTRGTYLGLLLAGILTAVPLLRVSGQWPVAPVPTTPHAQRNALGAVRSQVSWVQNATKVASSYGDRGYDNVWQNFQGLRQAYGAFKDTLNPRQQTYGANNFAELDAGLDIIQEAFDNYRKDLAGGRPVAPARQEMCRIVREGVGLWLQELNKTCTRLQVGWG